MNEYQPGLFEIKITSTGRTYIKKLFQVSLAVYILMAISTGVTLLSEIDLLIVYNKLSDSLKYSFWELRIQPFLYMAGTIINITGVVFYVRFYRSLFRSIDNHDEAGFNMSFRFAYINAILFIAVMLISFLADVSRIKNIVTDLF